MTAAMSREKILAMFDTDLADPGSVKSGEYLEAHVLAHARSAVSMDRQGLVNILTEWLSETSEPKTMLAVLIAKELRLTELLPNLRDLRVAIASERALLRFYVRWVDEALETLEAVSNPRNG